MPIQNEFNQANQQDHIQTLTRNGSLIVARVFTNEEIERIKSMLFDYFKANDQQDPYAVRDLLHEIPALKALILNASLLKILESIEPDFFLTKAIYFDKTPGSNWYVTWHQDIVINVSERIDIPGFNGWTRKGGIHGVVPPDEYLKSTVTVRIHLDDADESNGALKVIPGSHQKKLSDDEISQFTQNNIPNTCVVEAGGIHIMKPLLLHASSKATGEKHRRVIHLEFNTRDLPNALTWREKQVL